VQAICREELLSQAYPAIYLATRKLYQYLSTAKMVKVETPKDFGQAAPVKNGTKVELPTESEESSTSDESGPTPAASSVNSKEDLPADVADEQQQTALKKMQTLRDRGKIPNSFYVSVICIVLLQGCSGMYKLDTVKSWMSSIVTSVKRCSGIMEYERDLMKSIFTGDLREPMEYVQAGVVTLLVGSILWVLIGIPFKAGLWTGQRATRHKMHRYMGLSFLLQYVLAWVEFITNFHGAGEFSFLPHAVALNGTSCV
jgi:hypothetical protein